MEIILLENKIMSESERIKWIACMLYVISYLLTKLKMIFFLLGRYTSIFQSRIIQLIKIDYKIGEI